MYANTLTVCSLNKRPTKLQNLFRAISPVVGGIEDVISGVSMATSPIGQLIFYFILFLQRTEWV